MAKTWPTRSLQADREGHQVDVDREQHQLDRHQDDDDVLAVEEDAEDAEREQDRGDGQVVGEADLDHQHAAPAVGDLDHELDRRRRPSARYAAASLMRLAAHARTRSRRVSTMAPIIATSRTRPGGLEEVDVLGVEHARRAPGVADRRAGGRRRGAVLPAPGAMRPAAEDQQQLGQQDDADQRADRQVAQEAARAARRSRCRASSRRTGTARRRRRHRR